MDDPETTSDPKAMESDVVRSRGAEKEGAARRSRFETPTKLMPDAARVIIVFQMSRSESVPTSRRLRLRGQRSSITPDGVALDELAECFDDDVDTDTDAGVDAVELALDGGSAEDAIEALGRLTEADYDVTVRELVVEIRR